MALLGRQLVLHSTRVAQMEAADAGAGGGKPATPKADINLDNILKLIPGDVVSLYVTGKGIKAAAGAVPTFIQTHWGPIVFWICLAACGLLRILATKPEGQTRMLEGVNWSLVWVTMFAFLIWAHAVGDDPPLINGFSGAYAGFVAILFGLFAPKLVPAEAE